MKKIRNVIIAMSLVICFLFCFTACSYGDNPTGSNSPFASNIPTPTSSPTPSRRPTGTVLKDSQFPAIYVNTSGVPITSKEIYIPASISMSNTEKEYEFSNVSAEIRGRGNSTWILEKKPYRIKFATKQTMLDSGYKAKNWTLIANHSDKALLRNYSAYYLASQLDGLYFSPHTWFVDLYLNNEYQGVYMLCDHIQENEGRVDVDFNANPEDCEYLIEWDERILDEGVENVDYVVVGGIPFAVKFPDIEDMTPGHIADVKSFLTEVNTAINNADYTEIQKLIDINSFVDFFLVQELFKNVDVGLSSVFMQIKKIEGQRKIVMGPVWDFDISCGNADYMDYGPTGIWAQRKNNWFAKLMTTPFADTVVLRWNEIKGNQIESMLSEIEYMSTHYQSSFENNFVRWNVLGRYTWPNPAEVIAIKTYMAQVEYLLDWLGTRIDWLDDYYNKL